MTEDLMRREITDEFVLQGIGMITSPYVDKPVATETTPRIAQLSKHKHQ
jgi:hypothetical protein